MCVTVNAADFKSSPAELSLQLANNLKESICMCAQRNRFNVKRQDIAFFSTKKRRLKPPHSNILSPMLVVLALFAAVAWQPALACNSYLTLEYLDTANNTVTCADGKRAHSSFFPLP